ncbi:MAG: creatininase family protein, partial [Promethearchaeota archaeon]
MVNPKLRYENLRLSELEAMLRKCPLVVQPIGLLEWHGRQNALGMDGLASQTICERVIERLGEGVLMPTCWIGTYGYIHYPGTICYDENTAYSVYKNMFREFIKIGFKFILLVSGHGGKWQVNALKKARIDALEEMHSMITGEIGLIGADYSDLNPQINVGHAGDIETSILWKIGEDTNIELVNVDEFSVGYEKLEKYSLPDDEIITFDK